jgi:hypothetical protein
VLTEDKLLEKLHITAEEFRAAVSNKDYMRAKALYNKALAVTVYVELGEAVTSELFGQYKGLDDDEEAPKGLFPRDDVSKVDLECCIKRHKAYEDRTCQEQGQPAHFYSDEDYCARCQKRNRMH